MIQRRGTAGHAVADLVESGVLSAGEGIAPWFAAAWAERIVAVGTVGSRRALAERIGAAFGGDARLDGRTVAVDGRRLRLPVAVVDAAALELFAESDVSVGDPAGAAAALRPFRPVCPGCGGSPREADGIVCDGCGVGAVRGAAGQDNA